MSQTLAQALKSKIESDKSSNSKAAKEIGVTAVGLESVLAGSKPSKITRPKYAKYLGKSEDEILALAPKSTKSGKKSTSKKMKPGDSVGADYLAALKLVAKLVDEPWFKRVLAADKKKLSSLLDLV